MNRRNIFALSIVIAVAGAGILFVPLLFVRTLNCGGNNAALAVCKGIILEVRLAADDKTAALDIRKLLPQTKSAIVRCAQNHWTADTQYLICTNVSLLGNRQIVVVCKSAFLNVPMPTFWNGYKKTPAHAIAYSDGSAGLITPTDFAAFNFSEFVDATELETNSNLQMGVNK